MNDDDKMLSALRDEPLPPEASSEIFWARFGRDLDGAIARRGARRRVSAAFAVAAAFVAVLGVARLSLHHTTPTLSAPGSEIEGADDEASVGLAIEDFTDEEVARAIRAFPKGG